ncbi:hypothetical protein AK812_SmicGene4584 [Symbiodinium microadriaticum]|uniref:Uncharacterized protein n=1 Tax=Symbiodinium microadriaticum TaxID=2951 RepID=A0A1Q9EVY4_SYMMI|nr:hypothetical protein AK812_SmicGene4584 [Symbiodinium microadriaticum]
MSSSDGSRRVAALESWIRSHGGSICEAASVLDADGYRGVFAREALWPDIDFCRIPQKLLITERLAEGSLTFGQALRQSAEELMPSAAGLLLLTALLLRDSAAESARAAPGAGGESFFAPYYQALPTEVRQMPSCWPADHWLHAAIRGSHLERLVKAKRHSLGLEFSLLQSHAAEHIPICWEDFLWCRCMVASRAYSLPLDGVTSQRCMVPFADLLNHGQGEELSARYAFQPGSSADDGYVLMRITKPVADGREVFQTYGEKNMPTLFVDYGFCFQQACAVTSLQITAPICSEGSTAVQKEAYRKFWQLAGGPPGRKAITVEVDASGWRRVLPMLRAAAACNAEQEGASDYLDPTDVGLETLTCRSFRELCEHGLNRLPSSEEMRRRELRDWEVQAVPACVQVLEEERALLQLFVSLADQAISCLQPATSAKMQELPMAAGSLQEPFAEYLAQLRSLHCPRT